MGKISTPQSGSPLIDGDGNPLSLTAATSVVILWGISRARIQRFETARFRDIRDELEQLLQDSLGDGADRQLADAWIEATKSSWWSSDIDRGSTLTPVDVERLNLSGGLSYRVAQELSDDDLCREAVLQLLASLPDGRQRDELLAGLWLDELIELHSDDAPVPWPGLLDVDSAAGSHALADTASASDWDRFFELLAEVDPGLVNTWRPGGTSWSTPLHQAARSGADEQVVRRLLDLGAWKCLADRDGLIPLDLALLEGHSHLEELLTPPSWSSAELARYRWLQRHLESLLSSILSMPTARYRVPVIGVLAELGKPMIFDVATLGRQIVLDLDGVELMVEDRSTATDEEPTVYLLDSTGVVESVSRSESTSQVLPVGSSISGAEDSSALAEDCVDEPSSGDMTTVSKPKVERRKTPDLITSAMSDYGDAFFTVVPQSQLAEFAESPEGNSQGIVVTCSDYSKGTRWETVLPCNSAKELLGPTLRTRQWTFLIYITSIFRSERPDTALVECLQQQASSGLGPAENPEFLSRHRRRLGEAVVKRWGAINDLAVDHGVTPQRPGVRSAKTLPPLPPSGANPRSITSSPKRQTWESARRYEPPVRLYLHRVYGRAVAEWDGFRLVMKAGSICSDISHRSLPSNVRRIRDELRASGVLAERKDHLLLTRDQTFDWPSTAAAVVTGTAINGKREWVDKWGKSINDYLKEQQ